ncbi:MAG: nucleotide exchange factor GrpE [Cyanobacteria bacterium P01_F01_bin.150]
MTRSPRELAQQKIQQRKQQEKLFGDLLTIIDTLDRATEHWQKAQATNQIKADSLGANTTQSRTSGPLAASSTDSFAAPTTNQPPTSFTQRLKQWLGLFTPPASRTSSNSANYEASDNKPTSSASQNLQNTLSETITSALDGNQMIRTSLLEILAKHQVAPIPAQGQPFNPETMKALGQQLDASVPSNTVIQEVVRGYFWKDKVLREAQVIVSQAPT